jgi:hypothetical protein
LPLEIRTFREHMSPNRRIIAFEIPLTAGCKALLLFAVLGN